MFTELLFALGLGILAGIVTGITPGIHINLISVLVVTFSPFLNQYVGLIALCVFILAMSVVHTFLDSLPSIFLGAPDAAQALGVLPGHRYLLKGQGLMAVKLTVIGSFGALLLSLMLFPLFVVLVGVVYPFFQWGMLYLLLGVALFMLLRDKKRLWAILMFSLSGMFGFLVLNFPGLTNPLFPMLSGMFGISTLFMSLFENASIPPQKEQEEVQLKRWPTLKALCSALFSGGLTSMLPGLGSATAAVLAMQITRKLGDHGFMVLIGGINTVNFVLSLATLFVLEKARNGSVLAVQELFSLQSLQLSSLVLAVFLCAALLAGCAGVFLALSIGRGFARIMSKVPYKTVVGGIMVFITVLVLLLTGWRGLLVLIISTALGLIPAITKITRTHGMACLLVPVIVYFV